MPMPTSMSNICLTEIFSGLLGESLKLKKIVVMGKGAVEKQDLNPRFWWWADLQTSHFTALKHHTASFLGTKDKHRVDFSCLSRGAAAAMFQSLSAPSPPQLPTHIPTHFNDARCTCYPRSLSLLLACASVLLSGLFGDTTPAPPPTLLPPVPCEVTQRARSQQSQHVVWVSVSETSPPYVGLCA